VLDVVEVRPVPVPADCTDATPGEHAPPPPLAAHGAAVRAWAVERRA